MTNETKATHTPGPWRPVVVGTMTGRWIAIQGEENYFDDGSPREIAQTETVEVNERGSAAEDWQPVENAAEIWANARLIAAAPELLEALEEVKEHLGHLTLPGDNARMRAFTKALAAIAKARGEE